MYRYVGREKRHTLACLRGGITGGVSRHPACTRVLTHGPSNHADE